MLVKARKCACQCGPLARRRVLAVHTTADAGTRRSVHMLTRTVAVEGARVLHRLGYPVVFANAVFHWHVASVGVARTQHQCAALE